MNSAIYKSESSLNSVMTAKIDSETSTGSSMTTKDVAVGTSDLAKFTDFIDFAELNFRNKCENFVNSNDDMIYVEVSNVDADLFRKILLFLYTDEIDFSDCSVEAVIEIYRFAAEYKFNEIKQAAFQFLIEYCVADNCLPVLSECLVLKVPRLQEAVLAIIDKVATKVFNSSSFQLLEESTLKMLLARDSLVINEVDLFQAVVLWAGKRCEKLGIPANGVNQRQILTEILPLIRFGLLTMSELIRIVMPTEILTRSEIFSLFLFQINRNSSILAYSCKPRDVLSRRLILRRPGQARTSKQCFWRSLRTITFCADRDLVLIGIGLFGSLQNSWRSKTKTENESKKFGDLIKDDLRNTESNSKRRCNCDLYTNVVVGIVELDATKGRNRVLRLEKDNVPFFGLASTFHFYFQQSFRLLAGKFYQIFACYAAGRNALYLRTTYGSCPQQTVETVAGQKVTFQFRKVMLNESVEQLTVGRNITVNEIPELILLTD